MTPALTSSTDRAGSARVVRAGSRSRARAGFAARPNGFTLFEVVVALAVLVAIGALALPNLADLLERRRLDNQVDEVVGQMMLARAKAQSDGVLVELLFLPRSGTFVARSLGRAADAPARIGDGDRSGASSINEPWASRQVDPAITFEFGAHARGDASFGSGRGVDGSRLSSFARGRDAMGSGDAGDFDDETTVDGPLAFDLDGDHAHDDFTGPYVPSVMEAVDEALFSTGEDEAPQRVALFAGDGSAVVAGCCRLTDEHGRVVVIALNPWTGLPAVERGIRDDESGSVSRDRHGMETRRDRRSSSARDGAAMNRAAESATSSGVRSGQRGSRGGAVAAEPDAAHDWP